MICMICVSRKFLKIYRAISVKANFYMQFLVVEGFVGYGFRIHSLGVLASLLTDSLLLSHLVILHIR